jgi:hypothetical protein
MASGMGSGGGGVTVVNHIHGALIYERQLEKVIADTGVKYTKRSGGFTR